MAHSRTPTNAIKGRQGFQRTSAGVQAPTSNTEHPRARVNDNSAPEPNPVNAAYSRFTQREKPVTSLTCAETARLVRKDLHAHFPHTKFSVRSSNYAGGASIDVVWEDGPTTGEVDAVVDRFQGKDFDGMTDMATARPPIVVDGKPVRSGSDYVVTRRTLSEDKMTSLCGEIAQYVGHPVYLDDRARDLELPGTMPLSAREACHKLANNPGWLRQYM